MDDELTFGPEFHRLSFGDAVERGLLTDYKVMVLTVDKSVIAPRLAQELAGVSGELMLDDASKIVGCWNGLAKRAGAGVAAGEPPMRRAAAFAKDIKTSKQIAEMFPKVVEAYQELLDEHLGSDNTNRGLRCVAHHVDGTFNALERNEQLSWLKGVVAEDECRILTNARCLSEGVDVPALDAVLFLNPRNSIVDVVQSVGRVMRKSSETRTMATSSCRWRCPKVSNPRWRWPITSGSRLSGRCSTRCGRTMSGSTRWSTALRSTHRRRRRKV